MGLDDQNITTWLALFKEKFVPTFSQNSIPLINLEYSPELLNKYTKEKCIVFEGVEIYLEKFHRIPEMGYLIYKFPICIRFDCAFDWLYIYIVYTNNSWDDSEYIRAYVAF